MFIQVGQPAPEFSLQALVGDEFKTISLADFKEKKWVVFFFYPLDFTFVCPTEILEFNQRIQEFEKLNAVVLGASIDSVYSHKAWTQEIGKLSYPLLSDITQETARTYGILMEDKGYALRGLFIVDPEGILRYQVIHDLSIGRSADEILRVLSALQSGELCPASWKPGTKTLGKA